MIPATEADGVPQITATLAARIAALDAGIEAWDAAWAAFVRDAAQKFLLIVTNDAASASFGLGTTWAIGKAQEVVKSLEDLIYNKNPTVNPNAS